MTDELEQEMVPTTLDYLKNEADAMNLKYHPKIGEKKLREKIQARKKELEKEAKKAPEAPVTTSKSQGKTRVQKRKEQLQMVRVRVSCFNSAYKNLKGQTFSTSNSLCGVVKKYIPFDSPHGWHVPRILVDDLKTRTYQTFREVTTPTGKKVKRSHSIPAFNIQEMAPLSYDEYMKIQMNLKATEATEDY